MTTKPDDFAMYGDGASAAEPPRNESGGLRVAAFLQPCRTSSELAAFAKRVVAEDTEIAFIDENGNLELSASERQELRKNFTAEEWGVIEQTLAADRRVS
jgi:hypothetical protein